MGTENRLTATLATDDADHIGNVEDDLDLDRTEAERRLVREGLVRLGYREDEQHPEDLLVEYARKIGSVLGLSGLIMLGYGIFGFAAFRWIGFGLVMAGFALIAGGEFGPAAKAWFDRDSSDERIA